MHWAHYLSRDSVRLRRGARKCDFEAPDVLSAAISTLNEAVNSFNNKVVYRVDEIQDIAEDEIDTEDLPAGAPLADIKVSQPLFPRKAAANDCR
jgi:hypothetical protein